MLGRAISRLEWNASIGQSRADLDNRAAIARQHALQNRESTIHNAEIGDFGDPFVLLWFHLLDWRENRSHSIVHPDVDRSQFLLDRIGCLFDSRRIRHVGWDDEGRSAQVLNLAFCRLQSVKAPREQADLGSMSRKLPCSCSAYSGGSPGDPDGFWLHGNSF